VGLDPAVDLGGDRRVLAGLALQGGAFPLQDEGLADTGNGVDMHAEGGRDVRIGAMATWTVAVTEQEELGVPDLLGGRVPVSGDLFEALALLGCESNGVLVRCEHRGSPSAGQAGNRDGER
jgi:hypothetical protein